MDATSIRKGSFIMHKGDLWQVVDVTHRTPGNKRGFVQTKLRNLLDGTQREVKFSATQSVEKAHVDVREMEYLYSDGSGAVFMDTESYEQLSIDDEGVGDAKPWLAEGMRLQIDLLNGDPIGLQLPKTVEATVREAEAVVKGQTAARSSKPATLENGVSIQVPPFIEAGDRIKVDPGELRYIERVK